MAKLEDDNYLDLWKYFQDRADNVKEAMFNSVTWVIGFAAAILAFIFATLVDFNVEALRFKHALSVLGASFIGIVLCGYSAVLVLESKQHIKANWKRAKRCEKEVEGLKQLWDVCGKAWLEVWTRIFLVVGFFAAVFLVLFFAAAFQLLCDRA